MNTSNYSIDRIIKEELKMEGELPFKTETKTFPKGTVLFKPGDVFDNNYFIVSGIIQFSAYTKDNQEKILEFLYPKEFFGIYSFFTNASPTYYITCITDCTLETMPIKQYREGMETSFLLNGLSLYVLEYWFIRRLQKEKEMLTKTAEDRYYNLLKYRSDVIKQIPVSKIAKYLGIHPDSLSRIRRSKLLLQ